MKNFFYELYVRFKSETPDFFKNVRHILIVVAAIMGTLAESGIELNIYGYSVTQILAFATILASLITSLAVKDDANIEEKIKEIKNKK